MRCTGKPFQRKQTALARLSPGHLYVCLGGAFLANGVPFATGVAFALPAPIDGAATLANEAYVSTRHAG
jgi:hypothetical protein